MAIAKIVATKKAQSALEFLTTYGWAFLVILIMIGALSYFGVLDPSRFLPDKCLFGAGLGACQEFTAMSTSVLFKVTNNFGTPVNLAALGSGTSVTVNGLSTACTPTINASLAAGTTSGIGTALNTIGVWNASQTMYVNISCPGGIQLGERPTIDVVLSYTPSGLTYQKSVSGTVSVKRTQ